MRKTGKLAIVFGVIAAAIAGVGLTIAIAQTKPTPKEADQNVLFSQRLGL